jgi:large subunit ribosomal protein L19
MNALLIQEVTKDQLKNIPEIKAGMHVRVHEKVKEKDRERIQIFEGIVLAKKHGKGINATFTVRKVVDGIGVEKTWPLHSPMIEKIEIIKTPRVRRAKLYFLRHLSPTKIRKKLSVFESVVTEQETLTTENAIVNNNEKAEQDIKEPEK